jgi:hypothetical protein
MSLAEHLNEAVAKQKDATRRIVAARAKPATPDNLAEWLGALSDFSLALSDIQMFNNESVHEKLHELRERIGLKKFSKRSAG